MVFILYNLLFPVLLAVMLPYFLFRMCRRGGYAKGFAQRLGWYETSTREALSGKRRPWVHSVSVGETYVALKFMEEWRQRCPGMSFVLSVNTSTAHALASKALAEGDVLVYFPIDFAPVMRRVLRIMRPEILILTEGELWPNLIRLCRKGGVPVMLINGRMSERSFKGYFRFRVLFAPMLAMINRLCVQGEHDLRRFLKLGASAPDIVVTGSAKYDVALASRGDPMQAAAILASAGMSPGDLLLLGGSTWKGEEEVLLDYYIRAKSLFPGLKLVLVPRHAERRNEVLAAIEQRGLSYVQRSKSGPASAAAGADILLVDTTGELRHLYALVSVIFVGKSLTQHGGQNIIEPAVCGKPVVVGPNMENFQEITEEFLRADALIQVGSSGELSRVLDELLDDPRRRQAYGDRAGSLVSRNRGCLKLAIDEAERLLAVSRSGSGGSKGEA